ncbi:hypothetical protein DFJ73DRAFT_328862 [Zopfochytrium polystomum]|nr:hypothetical protein DFJ73DRAFT_328862 [Zopfochytrium polystomum]
MPIDPTDSTHSPRTSTAPQTDSTAANRASFFIASSHTSEESVEENHRRPTNRVVLQIPVNISPDDIDEDLDASDFDDEDDEFDDDDDEDEYEDDDEDYDDNENYDDDQTMDQREDDLSLLFRKQDLPDPASSRPPSPPGQSSSAFSPVLKDSPSRKSLLSEAIAGGGLQRSVSLFGDRLLNATSSRCPSTSNCPRATLAPLPGSAPSALNTAPLSAQPSASSIQVESQELLAVDAPVQAPSDTATVLSESLRRNLLFDRLMPFNVLHLKNHPTGATSGVPGPSQMGRGADPLADMDGWW